MNHPEQHPGLSAIEGAREKEEKPEFASAAQRSLYPDGYLGTRTAAQSPEPQVMSPDRDSVDWLQAFQEQAFPAFIKQTWTKPRAKYLRIRRGGARCSWSVFGEHLPSCKDDFVVYERQGEDLWRFQKMVVQSVEKPLAPPPKCPLSPTYEQVDWRAAFDLGLFPPYLESSPAFGKSRIVRVYHVGNKVFWGEALSSLPLAQDFAQYERVGRFYALVRWDLRKASQGGLFRDQAKPIRFPLPCSPPRCFTPAPAPAPAPQPTLCLVCDRHHRTEDHDEVVSRSIERGLCSTPESRLALVDNVHWDELTQRWSVEAPEQLHQRRPVGGTWERWSR